MCDVDFLPRLERDLLAVAVNKKPNNVARSRTVILELEYVTNVSRILFHCA